MNSQPDPVDDPIITTQAADCPKHGKFMQRLMVSPLADGLMIPMPCPKCSEERTRAERARAERQAAIDREVQVRRLTGDAGIPARFADRSFDGYVATTPGQKAALAICRRYAQDFDAQRRAGRSLVLTGGPGTGKTHLACATGTVAMEAHLAAVRFVTVSDMLRRIKETYRRDATASESDVIRGFVNCDLLILDEIGVQVGSEHEKLLLFEVLNGRYQDLRPTILLSNLPLADMEDFLGHRVMDRYRECGTVLAFDWESYRGSRA